MKKGSVALGMVCGMVLPILTGCSNRPNNVSSGNAGAAESTAVIATETAGSENASDAADLSGKEIICIMKDNVTPFHLSVAEGCENAGADYGVKITVQAPVSGAGGSNEEQAQLVEQAIASQVDCVVIVPVDSEGIVPAIKKLNEAGIPVINVNTKIAGEEAQYESFVAIENYQVGYQMAEALCEAMGGEGKIFVIEGTTGAQTSIDRTQGALDAIAEYPGVEVAAQQSASYNRAEAMNVVQNLLQQTPDVSAIFCCNDEMALGSAEAVNAANKTGEIMISGVDGNADTLVAISEGSIYATCNSNPVGQGYYGVYESVRYLSEGVTDPTYAIETILITEENVSEFLK